MGHLAATTYPTVLDLSATGFMDCSGLGVVLHAVRTAQRRAGSFTLARERSAQVARLIDLTGVSTALTDDRKT